MNTDNVHKSPMIFKHFINKTKTSVAQELIFINLLRIVFNLWILNFHHFIKITIY